MEEMKPCPLCGGTAILHADQLAVDPAPMYYTIYCPFCKLKLTRAGYMSYKEAIKVWNTRYEPTCHYEPEIIYSYYDDDDNEINTHLADDDGISYECSECGFAMLREGWFTEEPGEHGGWEIDKRWFEYCPGCGAKVVD